MKKTALLAILASCSALTAQEVRRATPVNSPSLENYDNPAWVGRVPSDAGVEVRRAEPVKPMVSPASLPSPVSEPTNTPTSALEDPKNIRISPAGGERNSANSALDGANSLYARKLYDLAIPQYEAFLISDSTSTARDVALFRLAECHRMAGNSAAARAAYEKLVMQFQRGEFAAAGAYRLGEILFSESLYQPAAIQFDFAAREAKEPGVRLAANYYAARSFEALKQYPSAQDHYRSVLASEGENPFRENAAIALAAIQLKEGQKQSALQTYEFLANSASAPDVASRSALQAGRLAIELGSMDKALQIFDKAGSNEKDPALKAEAILTALKLRYDSGDFRGITERSDEIEKGIPLSAQADAFSILAAAWRRVGNEQQAKKIYDRIVLENPSQASADVRYQRLLSLYSTKDARVVSEVDRFLANTTDTKLAASASLLKAEALFQKPDYAAAAQAYAPLVENPSLKPEQRAASLYKLAWSQDASGDTAGAVRSFTAFAQKYPDDKLAATSVLQRGLARQKSQSYEQALADFDEVITRFQFSKEVEIAILQKALTFGQLKKYPEMASAFQELLKRYPNSAASAQAHFWLGWVAFENKDYQQAIALLDKSRLLDAKNYTDRATLRILLAQYQLQDRTSASREAEDYKGGVIPAEVALWLGQGYFQDKKYAKAEKVLLPLLQSLGTISPDLWLLMSETRSALGKYEEASQAAEKSIASASNPSSQARGYLAKATAEIALRRTSSARQAVDQALFLQPEGKLNADARLISGEVFFLEQDYESAARAFMAVSILADDPKVTPRALRRAADSYRRAFKDDEADKALKELSERFPGANQSAGT